MKSRLGRAFYTLVWLGLLVGNASSVDSASISRRSANSEWWQQVELIDVSLHKRQWEYARKSARELADSILNQAWGDPELASILAELAFYQAVANANLELRELADSILNQAWGDPELASILAELAFYQAVANANLDLRDQAVWDWHTALNLDRWIAARDLEPYGLAAQLFVEYPLRRPGEMSVRFEQLDPALYHSATIPIAPNIPVPNLFNNSGASRKGSSSFKVELVVDRIGELHQPVVISKHLHPVVVYACLDWLRDLPKFEPALLDSKPIDVLYPLELDFSISTVGTETTFYEESP